MWSTLPDHLFSTNPPVSHGDETFLRLYVMTTDLKVLASYFGAEQGRTNKNKDQRIKFINLKSSASSAGHSEKPQSKEAIPSCFKSLPHN